MPFSANCPSCQLDLVLADRPVDNGGVQSAAFCPRCGYTEHGPPRLDRRMEVEPDFLLVVALPARRSAEQVKALRSSDPKLRDLAAADVLDRLRATSELEVGPFFPKREMERAKRQLKAAGLSVQERTR